jgi:hypothetical protein
MPLEIHWRSWLPDISHQNGNMSDPYNSNGPCGVFVADEVNLAQISQPANSFAGIKQRI